MGKSLLIGLVSVLVFLETASSQTILVREGDLCRFFRGRTAPPANWTALEFDAAAAGWEEGPTGIGYGDDDDATILSDMQNGYIAAFLRIEFDAPEGLDGFLWLLGVRYDDSFVAYLDGGEAARRGISGTPPAFDQVADATHEITAAQGFDESISLPTAGAILKPGRHVLAVEVHNMTLESTDLSFAAQLSTWPFIATSIAPNSGPVAGGNMVTINGQNFDPANVPQVRFGGKPSPEVTVSSSAALQVVVPAADDRGTVDVEIEDSRGRFTLPGGYRYIGFNQKGLSFDGGDSATGRCFSEDLDEGAFEVWFNRGQDIGFTWRVLLAVEIAGGGDAFRLEARGNRIRGRTYVGGTAQSLTANVTLGSGEWHHIALTFSRLGRNLYYDGAPVGNDALAMTIPRDSRLRLGAPFGTGTAFLGIIESARVWGFERTEREIRRDRFAILGASDDVEAAWLLDDGTGPLAGDTGAHGFSLVLGDTEAAEGNDPQWALIEDFPEVAVTELTPASGPIEGGTTVQIYGTGFSEKDLPRVRFGPNPSPTVTVLQPWEIEAATPAGAAYGAVDLTVETSKGTVQVPGAFTYQPGNIYSFIREGENWWYFVATQAPPADWAEVRFDPADWDWAEGPTGIGYGDGDDATDLPQMEGNTIALYARKTWEMAGRGEPIQYLILRIRYDDGFVVYLNGTEVARANMAGTPPAWDELASALHEITGGTGQFDAEIDLMNRKDLLRDGTNALAIEVHNQTIDSSDLSLSAELVYIAPGALFLRGDVDGSRSRNIIDTITLINYLFLDWKIPCEEAADIVDDGSIDVTDAVGLLEYLFKSGQPPRMPFADPLPDLDGDALKCGD